MDLQNGYDLLVRLGVLPSEWAVVRLENYLPASLFERLKEDRLDSEDEDQLAIAMVNVLADSDERFNPPNRR